MGSAEITSHTILNLGPRDTPVLIQILLLALVFIVGFDGFGEEFGWRGFALPYMLRKYSALTASLLLGSHLGTMASALCDDPWHFYV